jgi:hypothetical protein
VEQKRGFNYFKPENLGAIEPMGAILGENKPVWCSLLVCTSCCSYTRLNVGNGRYSKYFFEKNMLDINTIKVLKETYIRECETLVG